MSEGISVIMPTYKQAGYIKKAIDSLLAQSFTNWQLIIINDGSPDRTENIVKYYQPDKRIHYIRNGQNEGLGKALNQGLDMARHDLIAYLPSDDCYFSGHLQTLYDTLQNQPDSVLAYAGMKLHYNDSISRLPVTETCGPIDNMPLQLVQVLHRKTPDRWVERQEWSCADLFNMFWRKLTDKGTFAASGQYSCMWEQHPLQRHKIIDEKMGGSYNFYRQYYKVHQPLKVKVSDTKFVDEEKLYATFRKKCPEAPDGLKILLVGELAYNPERIYVLEEMGHKLYGLWMQRPNFAFCMVGPIPFGHIEEIPYEKRLEAIRELKPDIIYAQLNAGAIPIAHEIMKSHPDIPFVWHFKEGPSYARALGRWEQLIELYTCADGKIYINEETKKWYSQFIPEQGETMILDGDLPPKYWFEGECSPLLSATDGAVHTVTTGRVIGVSPGDIGILARENIHFHLYIESYADFWNSFIKPSLHLAPNHFHLHTHCPQADWRREFSQYDAGWLHCFNSVNNGELIRTGWDDLNLPARISTLAVAGIPMIQRDNSGNMVAMQALAEKLDIGVCFENFKHLATQLNDQELMTRLRANMQCHQQKFSFDYHTPGLIAFFRKVIAEKKK